MNLVDKPRVRIPGDEPVHDGHGLVRLADLVVRPGHLVEHLVVTLVVRVVFQNLLVGLDCLARSGRYRLAAQRQCRVEIFRDRQ